MHACAIDEISDARASSIALLKPAPRAFRDRGHQVAPTSADAQGDRIVVIMTVLLARGATGAPIIFLTQLTWRGGRRDRAPPEFAGSDYAAPA
jgi:hypothetical protein